MVVQKAKTTVARVLEIKTNKKSSRFEVSVQRRCRRIGVDNWQHSTLFFRFVISFLDLGKYNKIRRGEQDLTPKKKKEKERENGRKFGFLLLSVEEPN